MLPRRFPLIEWAETSFGGLIATSEWNFRLWHIADVPKVADDGSFRMASGRRQTGQPPSADLCGALAIVERR